MEPESRMNHEGESCPYGSWGVLVTYTCCIRARSVGKSEVYSNI